MRPVLRVQAPPLARIGSRAHRASAAPSGRHEVIPALGPVRTQMYLPNKVPGACPGRPAIRDLSQTEERSMMPWTLVEIAVAGCVIAVALWLVD